METMFFWFNLEHIGSFASIVGLGLTVYIFMGVRKIKQEFLFRARLPSLLKKIQGHASTISSELPKLPGSQNIIIEELVIAQVNIQSLENKSTGSMRISLKKLRIEIENIRKGGEINKEPIRAIYLNMNMIIQEITNIREDEKWSHGNG